MKSLILPIAPGAGSVVAQEYTNGSAATGTMTNVTGVVNASLFATMINHSVVDMWNEFIRPVEVAAIITTVTATPVPTN